MIFAVSRVWKIHFLSIFLLKGVASCKAALGFLSFKWGGTFDKTLLGASSFVGSSVPRNYIFKCGALRRAYGLGRADTGRAACFLEVPEVVLGVAM